MTAGSPLSASTPQQVCSTNGSRQPRQLHHQPTATTHGLQHQASSTVQTSCPSLNSSAAFQQVKQTQASLARLTRVYQLQQHQSLQQQQQQAVGSQNNQSSQQHLAKLPLDAGQQQQKPTTFVDCLIRRFKNCFDEDFCTVPMFVVGSLSPGSDGTHLILPPCVSLGRQNINRFSSPKNSRLMNPIRESCRSIEELDLGGNKLTDLIEVYKILQCTPNLRFLNLSENDLSRTSPVAMASLSASVPSSSVTSGSNNMIGITSLANANQQCTLSTGSFNQRTCLAPLNQNYQHQAMGARRHSSLGQPSAGTSRSPALSNPRSGTPVHLRAHQTVSRVAEARRMAAANALAQSKKTSSAVASKLASSAVAGGQLSRQATSSTRGTCNSADSSSTTQTIMGKQTPITASQRLQASQKSTMHFARSLSSLSAKDIRASNSAMNRLSAHRASIRNEADARTMSSSSNRRSAINSSSRFATYGLSGSQAKQISGSISSQQLRDKQEVASAANSKITTSKSHQKLYVEPIVESEDVDMSGDQQQQTSPDGQNPNSSACNNQTGAASTTIGQQQQPIQKNLQTTTGSNNTFRSFCNNNNSLLATCQQQQQTSNFRRTFESIKALALNNTGCQWKVVCSILSRMPNLEELHLSLNNYEKIDLDTNEFKHLSLKRLYLCNNPKLTNWEELDKLLIAFPSLEALSIADCNISQIPDNLDRAREWRKLCGLNINGWPIKEWPVVERLNQLPSLVDLKCRNLDVLNSIDEPRHHLIARLPKLQRLNGSEIEEREDAERAFLRFFMVNSHLERPARFHELMQIYGEVPQNIDVDVDLSPPSQARVRVIYLNRNHYCKADEDDVLMSEDFLLKLMDSIDARSRVQQAESITDVGNSQENMEVAEVDHSRPVRLFKDEGQEVMALEVDLRQSVRKFKSTIASLFGLESQNLILYYIDHEMVGLMGPELIKHNQKKLWNYNVQDGDQFIVEDR